MTCPFVGAFFGHLPGFSSMKDPFLRKKFCQGGCLSPLSEHSQAQTGVRSGSDLAVGMDLCFVLYLTRDGKTTASQVLFESAGSENNLANPTDTISWLHRYLKVQSLANQ